MIKLRKQKTHKEDLYLSFLGVWGIDIFNWFIDLRKWYKLMTASEKKKGMKWKDVTIWFCQQELDEMKQSEHYLKPKNKLLIKKVSFFRSSHMFGPIIRNLDKIISLIIGIIIGHIWVLKCGVIR